MTNIRKKKAPIKVDAGFTVTATVTVTLPLPLNFFIFRKNIFLNFINL
jgi:hypothetical protein